MKISSRVTADVWRHSKSSGNSLMDQVLITFLSSSSFGLSRMRNGVFLRETVVLQNSTCWIIWVKCQTPKEYYIRKLTWKCLTFKVLFARKGIVTSSTKIHIFCTQNNINMISSHVERWEQFRVWAQCGEDLRFSTVHRTFKLGNFVMRKRDNIHLRWRTLKWIYYGLWAVAQITSKHRDWPLSPKSKHNWLFFIGLKEECCCKSRKNDGQILTSTQTIVHHEENLLNKFFIFALHRHATISVNSSSRELLWWNASEGGGVQMKIYCRISSVVWTQ